MGKLKHFKAYLVGDPAISIHLDALDEASARVLAARLLQGEEGYVRLEETKYSTQDLLDELKKLAESGVLR